MRAALSQIILAQEPDFPLGGLIVSPSKLQVACGGARSLLQPRIMQVLVVLARRRGEVVSRDEMMAVCWGGFAVSDDAINRCIARLRRLAEIHGGFRLETIPRVGYQLSEVGAATKPPAEGRQVNSAPEEDSTGTQEPGQTWMAHHGAVAATAFTVGVLTATLLFFVAHSL